MTHRATDNKTAETPKLRIGDTIGPVWATGPTDSYNARGEHHWMFVCNNGHAFRAVPHQVRANWRKSGYACAACFKAFSDGERINGRAGALPEKQK